MEQHRKADTLHRAAREDELLEPDYTVAVARCHAADLQVAPCAPGHAPRQALTLRCR